MEKNYRQYERVSTGGGFRRLFLIGAVLLGTVCIIAVLVYRSHPAYKPPAFEKGAAEGEPKPPAELGYGVGGAKDAESFQSGLASKWIRTEDGKLPVWFSNPKGNEVYLMIRFYRSSDEAVIYESGLLRPGEYIENLEPLKVLSKEKVQAEAAIYSFDPKTYQSLGAFRLPGEIQ